MLEVLHIENIAIIEEADIRFEAGFNALTAPARTRRLSARCSPVWTPPSRRSRA